MTLNKLLNIIKPLFSLICKIDVIIHNKNYSKRDGYSLSICYKQDILAADHCISWCPSAWNLRGFLDPRWRLNEKWWSSKGWNYSLTGPTLHFGIQKCKIHILIQAEPKKRTINKHLDSKKGSIEKEHEEHLNQHTILHVRQPRSRKESNLSNVTQIITCKATRRIVSPDSRPGSHLRTQGVFCFLFHKPGELN